MQSLSELFKTRYRLILEESWYHERAEIRNPEKRWYEQIPTLCGGHIMLYAETPEIILEYYTPRARQTATKIFEQFEGEQGVRIDTHFSGSESILYFPAYLLDRVATLAGARRRRRLPDKSKEAFAEGRKKGMEALQKLKILLVQADATLQDERKASCQG